MPRVTQERLLGYGFQVIKETVPQIDEGDGQIIHGANGQPKTTEETVIVFVDPVSAHRVDVPLSEEARGEMVKQLTGGIVLPSGAGGGG